jgi:hypothetical protein
VLFTCLLDYVWRVSETWVFLVISCWIVYLRCYLMCWWLVLVTDWGGLADYRAWLVGVYVVGWGWIIYISYWLWLWLWLWGIGDGYCLLLFFLSNFITFDVDKNIFRNLLFLILSYLRFPSSWTIQLLNFMFRLIRINFRRRSNLVNITNLLFHKRIEKMLFLMTILNNIIITTITIIPHLNLIAIPLQSMIINLILISLSTTNNMIIVIEHLMTTSLLNNRLLLTTILNNVIILLVSIYISMTTIYIDLRYLCQQHLTQQFLLQ